MPSGDVEVIEADLTWMGNPPRFEGGVRIAVDEHGVIDEVGRLSQPATRRLTGRAILPGMINAHSHAFQHGLRGEAEHFPRADGTADFWTWRQVMYRLVESMDQQRCYELSRAAFSEMLAAGITSVGEFHYLHHDAREKGYALDEAVLRAAQDAGIRLVLIHCYYRTGGIDRPLGGGQRRFHTATPEEYWSQLDRLAASIDRSRQSLAAAAHSIRAASIDEIQELHEESIRRRLVFHMHVEEQPQEVADCVHRYGKPPMALLNERLEINPLFTAVHCTHTAAADLEEYVSSGGAICINPLTEGNLGDGIPDVPRILKNGGRIALGSDSNLRICWPEEMRWLEYGQRLRAQHRGVCVDESGRVAAKLFEFATIGGARSLGVKAGRIEAGHLADFFTIDVNSPMLEACAHHQVLEGFIFGTGNEAIAEVCVGGRWIEARSKAG